MKILRTEIHYETVKVHLTQGEADALLVQAVAHAADVFTGPGTRHTVTYDDDGVTIDIIQDKLPQTAEKAPSLMS